MRNVHPVCQCMIGKNTLKDRPKLKDRALKPLALVQINMYLLLYSVPSIEWYNHAVGFVDCNSGYQWLNGMERKNEILNVVKTMNVVKTVQ